MRGIHRVENDGTIGVHWEPTNVLDSVKDGHNFGHIVREFENKLVWRMRPTYGDGATERRTRASGQTT